MEQLEHIDPLPEEFAIFLTPTFITTDLPRRVSSAAAELMQKCSAICMSQEPGRTVPVGLSGELESINVSCSRLSTELETNDSQLSQHERTFDRFFRLRRSAHSDAFALGIAAATVAGAKEMQRINSLVPAECAAMVNALHRIAGEFLPGAQTESMLSLSDDGLADRLAVDSHARWRNGHVLFVGLIDAAIYFHLKALEAIAAKDNVATNFALRDASCIFHGSAAALRLAGDLAPKHYDDIRKLMEPPNLPAGFSGLWNIDHRQLLKLVKQLGTAIQTMYPAIASAHEEYLLSINAAYAAHRYVCQRVVGHAASLATQLRAPERPGHETLKALAKRTLNLAADDQRRHPHG
jgi:hypothetical protein